MIAFLAPAVHPVELLDRYFILSEPDRDPSCAHVARYEPPSSIST
jgi:hypothetical protein